MTTPATESIDYATTAPPTGPRPASLLARLGLAFAACAAAGLVGLWAAMLTRTLPIPDGWTHPAALFSIGVVGAWLAGLLLSTVALFQRARRRRVLVAGVLVCVASAVFWIVVVVTQSR